MEPEPLDLSVKMRDDGTEVAREVTRAAESFLQSRRDRAERSHDPIKGSPAERSARESLLAAADELRERADPVEHARLHAAIREFLSIHPREVAGQVKTATTEAERASPERTDARDDVRDAPNARVVATFNRGVPYQQRDAGARSAVELEAQRALAEILQDARKTSRVAETVFARAAGRSSLEFLRATTPDAPRRAEELKQAGATGHNFSSETYKLLGAIQDTATRTPLWEAAKYLQKATPASLEQLVHRDKEVLREARRYQAAEKHVRKAASDLKREERMSPRSSRSSMLPKWVRQRRLRAAEEAMLHASRNMLVVSRSLDQAKKAAQLRHGKSIAHAQQMAQDAQACMETLEKPFREAVETLYIAKRSLDGHATERLGKAPDARQLRYAGAENIGGVALHRFADQHGEWIAEGVTYGPMLEQLGLKAGDVVSLQRQDSGQRRMLVAQRVSVEGRSAVHGLDKRPAQEEALGRETHRTPAQRSDGVQASR